MASSKQVVVGNFGMVSIDPEDVPTNTRTRRSKYAELIGSVSEMESGKTVELLEENGNPISDEKDASRLYAGITGALRNLYGSADDSPIRVRKSNGRIFLHRK